MFISVSVVIFPSPKSYVMPNESPSISWALTITLTLWSTVNLSASLGYDMLTVGTSLIGLIVIETVAMLLSYTPSLALNVKLSAPL